MCSFNDWKGKKKKKALKLRNKASRSRFFQMENTFRAKRWAKRRKRIYICCLNPWWKSEWKRQDLLSWPQSAHPYTFWTRVVPFSWDFLTMVPRLLLTPVDMISLFSSLIDFNSPLNSSFTVIYFPPFWILILTLPSCRILHHFPKCNLLSYVLPGQYSKCKYITIF